MEDLKLNDFYQVAYLLANGIPMIRYEIYQSKITFHFTAKEKTVSLLENYIMGNPKIPVKDFIHKISELKNLIHSKV